MPGPQRAWVVANAAKLECDLATVEALARLALDARRLGCALRIEGCAEDLRELITFLGLDNVLVAPGNISGATASAEFRPDVRSPRSPTAPGDSSQSNTRRM